MTIKSLQVKTGLILAVLVALWAGGHVFTVMVAILCGVSTWEITRIRIHAPALTLGAGAATIFVVVLYAVSAAWLACFLTSVACTFILFFLSKKNLAAFLLLYCAVPGMAMIFVRNMSPEPFGLWLSALFVGIVLAAKFGSELTDHLMKDDSLPKFTASTSGPGFVGSVLAVVTFSGSMVKVGAGSVPHLGHANPAVAAAMAVCLAIVVHLAEVASEWYKAGTQQANTPVFNFTGGCFCSLWFVFTTTLFS